VVDHLACTSLGPVEAGLVYLGALTAAQDTTRLPALFAHLLESGCSLLAIREMILQTHLFAGFPAAINGFNDTISGDVRTFVVVQAATVVGMSGILFGLLRLT